jgi:hypothetical protein
MLLKRNLTTILIGLIAAGFGLISPVSVVSQDYSTPNEFELEYAGSALWSGLGRAVISGDHIYFGGINGLLVYDFSNPLSPRIVTQLYMHGLALRDMVVVGEYLYASASGTTQDSSLVSPIYIINISDPTFPEIAGTFPRNLRGSSFCTAGGYLYMSSWGGIHILDITEPGEPVWLDSVLTTNIVIDIAVADGILCYSGPLTISVYDLTDPVHPSFISEFNTPKSPGDIFLQDTLIYVADRDQMWPAYRSALSIVSIASPNEPVLLDTHPISGSIGYLDVVDSVAYVSSTNGVYAFDISDPSSIEQIGFNYTPSLLTSLVRLDQYLVGSSMVSITSDGSGGPCSICFCPGYPEPGQSAIIDRGDIEVIDISDPSEPCAVAAVYGPGPVLRLALHSEYAYVLGKSREVQIVDISHSERLDWIGSIKTDHVVGALTVSGNYLALGGYIPPLTKDSSGISLYDITHPAEPILLGSFSNWFSVAAIAIRYPYVFVAAGSNGLEVVDFTVPDHPEHLGRWDIDYARDVLVEQNLAYIAGGDELVIIDVSDPANVDPFLVGDFPDVSAGYLVKSGNLLYASTNIFDVTNPGQPVIVGGTPGTGRDMAIAGNRANLLVKADAQNGIYVLDVSDPAEVIEVSSYNTRGTVVEVAADSAYVYVADNYGLIRLRLPEATAVENNDDISAHIPKSFALNQNYPNPFNPSTIIEYDLPRSSNTRLTVYNIMGQEVRTLIDEHQSAGHHTVTWDGRDTHSDIVASGVYLYRLTANSTSHARKMLLIK